MTARMLRELADIVEGKYLGYVAAIDFMQRTDEGAEEVDYPPAADYVNVTVRFRDGNGKNAQVFYSWDFFSTLQQWELTV